MSNAFSFAFASPWALLLLLLAPVVGWWLRKQWATRYPQLRMPTLGAVAHLTSWRAQLRRSLPWLRALALVCLVIALARPQRLLQEESVTAEGIDMVLAMDLSGSMLTQDFRPNRLEASKRVAMDFVRQREHDRIGVVAFAGEAFTQCPLTTDHDVVRTYLGGLTTGSLVDGTAIGQGLATAINRLKDQKTASKVVILLTDGVNTAGYLSPEQAAQIAAELGVKVYTIGVGSRGEAIAPVSRDRYGRYQYDKVKVELDEDLLGQIAQQTGGRYFRATNQAELEEIYGEIDRLEKTEIETTVIRREQEYFRFFALVAALLILLEMVLRYTILRAIP